MLTACQARSLLQMEAAFGGGGGPMQRQNFESEVLAIIEWTRGRYLNCGSLV